MRTELWAEAYTDARTPESRSEERQELQRSCDDWLNQGHEITQCEPCLFLDSLNNYGQQLIL